MILKVFPSIIKAPDSLSVYFISRWSHRESVFAYLHNPATGQLSEGLQIPYTCMTSESISHSLTFLVGAVAEEIWMLYRPNSYSLDLDLNNIVLGTEIAHIAWIVCFSFPLALKTTQLKFTQKTGGRSYGYFIVEIYGICTRRFYALYPSLSIVIKTHVYASIDRGLALQRSTNSTGTSWLRIPLWRWQRWTTMSMWVYSVVPWNVLPTCFGATASVTTVIPIISAQDKSCVVEKRICALHNHVLTHF